MLPHYNLQNVDTYWSVLSEDEKAHWKLVADGFYVAPVIWFRVLFSYGRTNLVVCGNSTSFID